MNKLQKKKLLLNKKKLNILTLMNDEETSIFFLKSWIKKHVFSFKIERKKSLQTKYTNYILKDVYNEIKSKLVLNFV